MESTMARPTSPTLLPDASGLHLVRLEADEQFILAVVETTSPEALCPLCQCRSQNVHSRYVRVVADLPWAGWAVRLELHVRRFFCLNKECMRQIFTERLPHVVAPYARRTTRLTDLFTLIGFALGGEAGKRLVDGMGLETSPDALLRLVRAQQESQVPTPRVLGVDDFCFCRRRSYGAILIDLERRVPIDLLPDREAETFKKWLLAHRGVQIISRDRGGAFADGARQGAPQAQQIADRWHLLANLSETMKGFFLNKQAQLKALVQKPPEDLCEEEAKQLAPWQTSMRKHLEAKSLQLHQERVTRYKQIHELHAKKVNPTTIARQVGVSRQCVYEYLRMQQPPERTHIVPSRQPMLEPYKDYLVRRWNEGCRNAQQAYREVKEQGYPGGDSNIVRFFGHLRKHFNQSGTFKEVDPATQTPVQAPPKRPPSASQVAHWITFKEEQRLDWQKKYLAQLCEADQEIRETYELITDFTTMLRERQGERLDAWLQKVETQGIVELKNFAQGVKRDYDAVKAGLTLEWSNGQTEGQVNRLNLLKRQMYGRGRFDLLRKRVLKRA
jgi:transposase